MTEAAISTEVLAGLVERVTFHNPENGFCVLRVKARGHRDLVTTVGHAAMNSAGEWITASGIWINDRTHGLQFKANPIGRQGLRNRHRRLGAQTRKNVELASLQVGTHAPPPRAQHQQGHAGTIHPHGVNGWSMFLIELR